MIGEEIKTVIYKKVLACGTSGRINVPRSLVGQDVQIRFFRELNSKELEMIRKHNLKLKLQEIKTLK